MDRRRFLPSQTQDGFQSAYKTISVWRQRFSGWRRSTSWASRQKKLYEAYQKSNGITPNLRRLLSDAVRSFESLPCISIVMPVFNVDPRWLNLAIESVQDQIYSNWELCLVDDGSTRSDLIDFLDRLSNDNDIADDRIRISRSTENRHICEASNSAAQMATGDFIALLDHDDQLAPHALWEIAHLLQSKPDADLIYSDEDKIDEQGTRYDPQFKPDWSPELLLSYNYINHLTCLRRSLFEELGGFRAGFEYAQDYDLLLRVVSQTERIEHIPKVLYHWRAIETSVAKAAAVKSEMQSVVQRALADHLLRNNVAAKTYAPAIAEKLGVPINQLDWPDDGPRVAIVIPTRNQHQLLRSCIESIRRRTTYVSYRIVVVDNESNDPAAINYLQAIEKQGVEVLRIPNDREGFSFSRIINRTVANLEDELILLLNNDIEASEPRWLSRMVGYLSLPGVAITGARLLYPNRTVQHAGAILGMSYGISPQHAFLDQAATQCSYGFQAEVARNCSAVTGACLLIRREEFVRHRGLDEKMAVGFSDVDLCLRLIDSGKRVVYVPGAELIHHESESRSKYDCPDDLAEFRSRHGHRVDGFYSPNLSNNESHVIDPAGRHTYARLVNRPIRALLLSHNLNLEGAPKALYELAVGLQRRGVIAPTILSPKEGPLRQWYEKAGVPVVVGDHAKTPMANGWLDKQGFSRWTHILRKVIQRCRPDVAVINTVLGAAAVNVASELGIPAIWTIYESYTPRQLFRQFHSNQHEELRRAFKLASTVVFCSEGTAAHYKKLVRPEKSRVIHNGIDRSSIEEHRLALSRQDARSHTMAPAGKKVVLSVGTVCARKSQHVLVKAASYLRHKRDDFICQIVGLRNSKPLHGYNNRLESLIRSNGLSEIVQLVPETERVYDYYRAADIFVLSSLVEGYNLSVLEAQAFSLPILTTPCCGATEQNRDHVNARFFQFGDSKTLANLLDTLLGDDERRAWMGQNSRSWFNCLKTYDEMTREYEDLAVSAALERWESCLENG